MIGPFTTRCKAASAEHEAAHRLRDVLYISIAVRVTFHQRQDLVLKIGVMLGDRPDHENQMQGIHRSHFPFADPHFDHLSTRLHPWQNHLADRTSVMGRTMNDFHGEYPGGTGIRHDPPEFFPDQRPDRGRRIGLRCEALENVVPLPGDVVQNGVVKPSLRTKVIDEIGLGQVRPSSNHLQTRCAEPLTSERVARGSENPVALLMPIEMAFIHTDREGV
ncbi:hypothetical protein BA897_01950 [Spiribacter roseus]|nr:hypothetical protein BA897_01950 [Spiribacter roseus]